MIRADITELFRYYGKLSFAKEVITKQLVYFPRTVDFNDPFDGSIPFEIDLNPSELVGAIHRIYLKDGHKWPAIKRFMDNYINPDGTIKPDKEASIKGIAAQFRQSNASAGVFCLTEVPDSILMWSHYANKHQGVCIGFRRSSDNALGDDDICCPVTYSDVYPTPRFSQIFAGDASLTKGLLFTKATGWAYESEWRSMGKDGGKHYPSPGPISRIILGCRASQATVEEFTNLSQTHGVPLQRATQDIGQFSLTIG